jgi:SAM-dependent methyltransferase
MSDRVSTSELRETWESAAPGWAKWETEFAKNLVGPTEKLLDLAGVASGMRVLDLACGAGSQTLKAAARVGEGGHIVACDIASEMLVHLGRNAERAGLDNIETLCSAAEDLADAVPPFDAAISRLGLMLFASPKDALAAVQSVLKPGARFAALVFTTPDNNPYQSEPMAILRRHAAAPPPAPQAPGLFALGAPGVLEGLLRDSGFADIEMVTLRAPVRLASADDALAFLREAAGAYRAVVAHLSDEAQAAAWAEVRDCVGQFETETGFETAYELIIGSGAKPS